MAIKGNTFVEFGTDLCLCAFVAMLLKPFSCLSQSRFSDNQTHKH